MALTAPPKVWASVAAVSAIWEDGASLLVVEDLIPVNRRIVAAIGLKQPGGGAGKDGRKPSSGEERGQGGANGADAATSARSSTGFEGSPELPGQR